MSRPGQGRHLGPGRDELAGHQKFGGLPTFTGQPWCQLEDRCDTLTFGSQTSKERQVNYPPLEGQACKRASVDKTEIAETRTDQMSTLHASEAPHRLVLLQPAAVQQPQPAMCELSGSLIPGYNASSINIDPT